jgi:hypothetical protein
VNESEEKKEIIDNKSNKSDSIYIEDESWFSWNEFFWISQIITK